MSADVPHREVTPAARRSLARRFNLPHDPFSQDWQWEAADSSRFSEFLGVYESGDLDKDERFALMEILIQCIEDSDSSSVELSPQWRSLTKLLQAHADLHASSIQYWSCLDDRDLEDCFRVTKLMRAILDIIRWTDDEHRDLGHC